MKHKLPLRFLALTFLVVNPIVFVIAQDFPTMQSIVQKKDGEPSLSNDNKRVVFSTGDGFARNLSIMNIETKEVTILTSNEFEDSHPRWSPDSQRIVFQREDTLGNRDIWIMNVDGKEDRNITKTINYNEQHPRFSNDGKYLIFDANKDEGSLDTEFHNYEIYKLHLESGKISRLTVWSGWDMYASFSPDNKYMVWRRTVLVDEAGSKNFEIFVKNLETGEERNISNHEAYDSNPHWSPTADLIVFASNRNGTMNLYTMKRDGSALVMITQAEGRSIGFGIPTISFDGEQIIANRYVKGITDAVLIKLK
jgi:Tol biopolymer transport system component